MKREITKKEKERVMLRGAFILFAFFALAFLITYSLPLEERFLPFVDVVLLGLFASGVYEARKLARSYGEFVWAITSFVILILMLGQISYYRYFIGEGAPSLYSVILLSFLVFVPASTSVGFFVQEILLALKIRKTLTFHAKRFFSLMMLVGILILLFSGVSSLINLLAPFLPSEYLIAAFIFGLLLSAIASIVLINRSRVSRFLSDLSKEEFNVPSSSWS
jgi:hypothetical protein